jgi:hypothetical protein
VADPYAWYWTTSSAHAASTSPSAGLLAIVVLTPFVALFVLCVGLELWDRREARARTSASTLTAGERRALASIGRGLWRDDPELARRLTSVDALITGDIR